MGRLSKPVGLPTEPPLTPPESASERSSHSIDRTGFTPSARCFLHPNCRCPCSIDRIGIDRCRGFRSTRSELVRSTVPARDLATLRFGGDVPPGDTRPSLLPPDTNGGRSPRRPPSNNTCVRSSFHGACKLALPGAGWPVIWWPFPVRSDLDRVELNDWLPSSAAHAPKPTRPNRPPPARRMNPKTSPTRPRSLAHVAAGAACWHRNARVCGIGGRSPGLTPNSSQSLHPDSRRPGQQQLKAYQPRGGVRVAGWLTSPASGSDIN